MITFDIIGALTIPMLILLGIVMFFRPSRFLIGLTVAGEQCISYLMLVSFIYAPVELKASLCVFYFAMYHYTKCLNGRGHSIKSISNIYLFYSIYYLLLSTYFILMNFVFEESLKIVHYIAIVQQIIDFICKFLILCLVAFGGLKVGNNKRKPFLGDDIGPFCYSSSRYHKQQR